MTTGSGVQVDDGELEYWQMPESALAWSEKHNERYAEWIAECKETGKQLEDTRKEARKMRPEIIGRDGRLCRSCGTTQKLTVDHIVPLSRGGTNDLDNLQLLCRSCNSIKSAKV